MRMVKVHVSNSICFTSSAAQYCQMLNEYKRQNPSATFDDMATAFDLSRTNARRYYYGYHDRNEFLNTYAEMRRGACVKI